ncbi:hypothetical protein LCGC14_0725850 [marine sediment metagenome]|uniref:Uncharacterized protein n=1 Tax=marine sediment metagenome TaxID=412755 RepID=A0A0F9QF96_9ZZZZ|nr:hypothetical protein [Candidatus Aminicenantes bacterium]
MLEKLPRIREQLNLDEPMMKVLQYALAPKKNQANALFKLSLMVQIETLEELRKLNENYCRKDCCDEDKAKEPEEKTDEPEKSKEDEPEESKFKKLLKGRDKK